MSKLLRTAVLLFTISIPAVALASDGPSCCSDGHCCPGCPFCHHH